MQTIWTRVAQVRASCHCPQCKSATNAVARRAAATATRPAPRLWTSSTVWYSGIFAVAATLDLGVKQQRREQWNKAISDVKQELSQSSDADANRAFLDSLEEETVASADMRDNLDSSPLRTHVPEWPASTGQERQTNKLPPQSIYTDNRKKAKHMLDRWHPKKLERTRLSIDALQLEFFVELHRRGWHEEAAAAVPAWYAERILQPLETIDKALRRKHIDLNAVYCMQGKYTMTGEDEQGALARFAQWKRSEGDVPLCDYAQDEMGHYHSIAHDLNTSLGTLFDKGRDCTLSQPAALAKVFYNLSLSSAPPNVDTFNTLILGLSDIGTRRLVEGSIHSMHCAKMRHNEVSLASILNYWTMTGNEEEFQYWFHLMRGEWGGLALAQPGVEITQSSQGRLKWKGIKIVQLPSPTPMVFSALIKGVIKFSGFDAALDVCETAREEGWGLCMSGLAPLLKDCSKRRDWVAGLATWKQIQELRTIAAKRFKKGVFLQSQQVSLPTFASMLQLCTRCSNGTAFQDVMEQAVMTYPGAANHLIRMVRAEQSEMHASDREHEFVVGKLKPTSDISQWLETQKVNEYVPALGNMRWQDMVKLNDAELTAQGVVNIEARRKLLEIFRQVDEIGPVYDTVDISWLPVAWERRKRKRQKQEREEAHLIWRRVEIERHEAHERDPAQARGKENQQARHDDAQHVQPLVVAGELGQHASYAVGMTSTTSQPQPAYQPF